MRLFKNFIPIITFVKCPICVFVLFWAFTTEIFSQEMQVPVDNEGKIESINAELNTKIGLFNEYAGFKEARLFEIAENEFVLEIYYKAENRLLRKRIPYTYNEVQTLRSRITAALQGSQQEGTLDQEGRTKLIITSTGASLAFYGLAIPKVLDLNSNKAFASTYMFTSALGFYVPFAATRNTTVTEASANAYFYGTTRGAAHGLMMNFLAFGNGNSTRRNFGFSMAGSVGEAVLLYKVSTAQNWSTGKVELAGVGGDFGMAIGFVTPALLNMENWADTRFGAASVLIGSGIGFGAGHYLSGTDHYTQGDAFVIRGAGTMGAYAAISAVNLTNSENENAYAGAFIASSLGGLFLGNQLVQEKDFSTAQGTFIELGQLAGWLTGLGIAYLIMDPNSSDSRLFTSMSAMGGAAGYTIMYRTFADKAREKAARSSWNFHLMPQNLVLSRLNKSFGKSVFPMPVVTLDVQL